MVLRVIDKVKFYILIDLEDDIRRLFLIDLNAVLQAILYKNHYENIEFSLSFCWKC